MIDDGQLQLTFQKQAPPCACGNSDYINMFKVIMAFRHGEETHARTLLYKYLTALFNTIHMWTVFCTVKVKPIIHIYKCKFLTSISSKALKTKLHTIKIKSNTGCPG